jgi:hypothetical protein
MSSRDIQRKRVILGFLVATATPAPLLVILIGPKRLELVIMVMITSLLITIPPVVVVAIPLYLWLSRSGHLRLYWVALVGAVTGATWWLFDVILSAAHYIMWWPDGKWEHVWTEPTFARRTLIAMLLGIISAVVGWLIMFGPCLAPRTEQ